MEDLQQDYFVPLSVNEKAGTLFSFLRRSKLKGRRELAVSREWKTLFLLRGEIYLKPLLPFRFERLSIFLFPQGDLFLGFPEERIDLPS